MKLPATNQANPITLLTERLPILADALQDAGCEDLVILDHCRAHTQHTANCWALKALLADPPKA